MSLPYPFRGRPVSTVQPFTYSDGDTYLSKLERLIKWLQMLVEAVNGHDEEFARIDKAIAAVIAKFEKEIADANKYTADEIDKLRQELINLIGLANDEGVAFNPTNGTNHQPISRVISDVYDNLRYHGLFAVEYDSMGLTAAQYDELDLIARKYDLSPFTDDNHAYIKDEG